VPLQADLAIAKLLANTDPNACISSSQPPFAEVLRRPVESAQYASQAYRAYLSTAGITASMSRKADCYDNAPMESFFHTLKTELVRHCQYQTRAEAQRESLPSSRASTIRLHSAIGIAPIEMEQKAA
jgi:transposase InsO family protein